MENLWERGDLPLFEIPNAPKYHLANAPLVQALAQVRFPLIASLESMSGIAPLQEALRAEFPYMKQQKVQQLSVSVGSAGAVEGSAAESITWSLSNDAGSSIVVGAGTATLSAGVEYTGVADFVDDFELMLAALEEVSVARCDRLGVRYLSLAADLPSEDRSWRKWFKPELLGWAGSDVLAEGALATSMNQVQLGLQPVDDLSGVPSAIEAIIRHGAVPADTIVPGIPPIQVEVSSYLLDLDVFASLPQAFDSDALREQFLVFHGQVDRFFYWSLTDAGGEHFGIEVRNG